MVVLTNTILRFLLLCAFLLQGCAQSISPVISKPDALLPSEKLGKNYLNGTFIREDGSVQSLADLNDKPILLFFVGEFCGSCRQEAQHLKEFIAEKGLPTKVHLVSIMLEVDPGTATSWLNGITPPSFSWQLGSDPELSLYFSYFNQLTTPSMIYFEPSTSVLKRWQQVVPLIELQKETVSWY